jgi:hypothetical protein
MFRQNRDLFAAAHGASSQDLSIPPTGNGIITPMLRLDMHQIAMATNFWKTLLVPEGRPTEAVHQTVSYYNLTVRKDLVINESIRRVLNGKTMEEDDKVTETVLKLERHLWGDRRFVVTSNKYFMAGVTFEEEIKEPNDIAKVHLPVISHHANLVLTPKDTGGGGQFHNWLLSCGEEVGQYVGALTAQTPHLLFREMKPQVPLSFYEALREKILLAWSYWFMFWLIFWCVDEEIITLISLIVSKLIADRNQRREAKAAGGKKVYVVQKARNW